MIVIEVAALIIIGILLFELIIFCHEGGHFIAAKLSGVRVNEFALGMGPKLFQFTKGETTYSLRLLPIGGYCAMEGEDEQSEDPEGVRQQAGVEAYHHRMRGRVYEYCARPFDDAHYRSTAAYVCDDNDRRFP